MLNFVTGNKIKFKSAQEYLHSLEIAITQKDLSLEEIQSDSIETIVVHKANQAFNILSSPILITDHGWSIHGLKGFPGPYMKYMNEWFTAQNFLDLTKNLKDRRIILHEVVCFKDNSGYKVFSKDHQGTLLSEIKGDETIYPAMTICSFIPGISEAEAIKSGQQSFDSTSIWEEFSNWYKNHTK